MSYQLLPLIMADAKVTDCPTTIARRDSSSSNYRPATSIGQQPIHTGLSTNLDLTSCRTSSISSTRDDTCLAGTPRSPPVTYTFSIKGSTTASSALMPPASPSKHLVMQPDNEPGSAVFSLRAEGGRGQSHQKGSSSSLKGDGSSFDRDESGASLPSLLGKM